MKNFILSLMVFLFIGALSITAVYADEYYVSNTGDDNNLGTSVNEPWRSLSKVNNYNFMPGDVIHFKANDLWRGQLVPASGNENGHVTYTSYGTGEKPQLLGSISKNKSSDWKMESKNIWIAYNNKTNSPSKILVDVGNIIFNSGETCGVKVFSQSDLNNQNDYFYDDNNKTLKIYSKINPAEMYSEIECALSKDIINENDKSYVIYDGLELKYGGAHGIGGDSTNHIKVINCDINYIGGGKFIYDNEIIRYGNGIEFWSDAHDILVEGCNIWEIYDTALTNQGNREGYEQYNINYRNNTIWNAQWSFELWYQDEKSVLRDIYFENNICKNAGFGWGSNQRPDGSLGVHMSLFESYAKASNINIRNNTFENAKTGVFYMADSWNGSENISLENNKYYQPESSFFAYFKGEIIKTTEFNKYKTLSGMDEGSSLSYNSNNYSEEIAYIGEANK